MKQIRALFLLVLFSAFPANAQRIYKCSDGAYQQTPCASNSKPAAVIHYTPEPDAPHTTYYAEPAQSFSFGGRQQSVQSQHQPSGRSTAGLISNPNRPSLQDRLSSIASDPAYKGRPSARRAAMNAAMQETGLQGAGDYNAPRAPMPSDNIGQPVQVIDQGTSMPIPGAIKVAPNMIWDPNTGQYRETY